MYDELTQVDIDKMQEEINHRVRVLRPQLIEEVQTARAFGDLSENFEYKCAKQAKNRNESRIRYLERMIRTAKVIEVKQTADTVGLFDQVTIYNEMVKKEMTILWLVGIGMLASLILAGCVDAPGAMNSFTVVLPYTISFVFGISTVWGLWRLFEGGNPLRAYIYKASQAIFIAFFLLSVFSREKRGFFLLISLNSS